MDQTLNRSRKQLYTGRERWQASCYYSGKISSYEEIRLYKNPESKVDGANMGPPGSCRPQLGPTLAPWTLLSGSLIMCMIRGIYCMIHADVCHMPPHGWLVYAYMTTALYATDVTANTRPPWQYHCHTHTHRYIHTYIYIYIYIYVNSVIEICYHCGRNCSPNENVSL